MSIEGINLTNKVCIVRLSFFMKTLQATHKDPKTRKFFADGGFGCDPDAMGTKVFGYWLEDSQRDTIRRSDVESVTDEIIPASPAKPVVAKPKYNGKHVEQVNPCELRSYVDVHLWSDTERFSNGSMHMGHLLGTYVDNGKSGNIIGGGDQITVEVEGRIWGIKLQTLVELAQLADKQREERGK